MIGRVIGLVIGLAIAALGYGLYKPAVFAKYVDLAHVELGPFGQYRDIVAGLVAVVGVVVALASLQRSGRPKRSAPAVTLFAEPEPASEPDFKIEPELSHGGAGHAPAEDHGHHEAHDDHGSPDAHDDHGGHDDHGAHGEHEPAHHH